MKSFSQRGRGRGSSESKEPPLDPPALWIWHSALMMTSFIAWTQWEKVIPLRWGTLTHDPRNTRWVPSRGCHHKCNHVHQCFKYIAFTPCFCILHKVFRSRNSPPTFHSSTTTKRWVILPPFDAPFFEASVSTFGLPIWQVLVELSPLSQALQQRTDQWEFASAFFLSTRK